MMAKFVTTYVRKMPSSGMLRHLARVSTDVSEETKANVVPTSQILVTLMMEALCSSKTSVLTRLTRRNIPKDGILHSHSRETLKFYTALGISIPTQRISEGKAE
jgi:hypothetical protein